MKKSVLYSILFNGKKGVSDIVATVIIIALVIVAITIVWLAVLPLIKDKVGNSDVCSSVDVSIETAQGYTCWAEDKNLTLVQIKKGSNNVDISKMKFIISSNGNSISFTNDTVLPRNSYGVYYLNTTEILNIEKIEVVPYVKKDNTETICSIVFIDDVSNCGISVLTISEVENIVNSGVVINREGGSAFSTAKNSPLIINIASPINNSVYTTNLVWFNFSSDQIVDWEYSLNGAANVSFIENVSSVLVNGNYNITVYANNSNGTSSVFLNFSVNKPCSSQNAQGFYNGTGTVSDPYGICNCTMLQNMRSYLNANYVLLNDIDCSMTNTWNGGSGFMPVGNSTSSSYYFSGSFNGTNHVITNLSINRPSLNDVGLFGYLSGIVYNVGVVDVNMSGNSYVGGLAGNLYGTIYSSYSTGVVRGANFDTGGLVGLQAGGSIYNSYSFVNVIGNKYAGGLVGVESGGKINNSYSIGSVTAVLSPGGFIGSQIMTARANYDYWDNQTSGQTVGCGPNSYYCATVFGKTTAQMKDQNTYAGWDFTNVWAIDVNKNNGYPYLRWQNL